MRKIKSLFALSIATIVGGACNYAVYPILLHHLSLSDFATFSVVSSVITLFSIPANGFGYYILLQSKQQQESFRKNFSFWKKALWFYSCLYTVFICLFLVSVGPYIGITDYLVISLLGILFLRALSNAFFNSILQAHKEFVILSGISVLVAVSKLIFSFATVFSGTLLVSVSMLVISGLIGSSVTVYYGLKVHTVALPLKAGDSLSRSNSLAIAIFLISMITFLQSFDVILVKYLFNDNNVALYAAVSIITKFLLIVISILEGVFLPDLLEKREYARNTRYYSMLCILALIGCGLSIYILPYIGTNFLTLLRPELSGGFLLFGYLGVASIMLGFFIISIKSIALKSVSILPYILIVGVTFYEIVQTHGLVDFSFYYMLGMVGLFTLSAGHKYLELISINKD